MDEMNDKEEVSRLRTLRMDQGVRQALASMGLLTGDARHDANETMFFKRELEFIYAETYQKLFPELKARSLLPVDTSVAPWAETVTYRQFEGVGRPANVVNWATDFPSVELSGTETTNKVFSLGASFQYSVMDIRRARAAGRPVDTMKAALVRESMERELDLIACMGDTQSLTTGIYNAANTITGATAGVWASASADTIVSEITTACNLMFTTSKGVHRPDTLVLGTSNYSLLSAKRFNTTTDDSVIDYLLKKNPFLKSVEYWPRLDLSATSGTKEGVLLMEKNPRNAALVIPQEFEMFAPQARNMAFVTSCHMRYAGVQVKYPKSILTIAGTVA